MGLPGPFENCPARSKVSFCLAGHTFAIAVRSLGPAAGVALAALVAVAMQPPTLEVQAASRARRTLALQAQVVNS